MQDTFTINLTTEEVKAIYRARGLIRLSPSLDFLAGKIQAIMEQIKDKQ